MRSIVLAAILAAAPGLVSAQAAEPVCSTQGQITTCKYADGLVASITHYPGFLQIEQHSTSSQVPSFGNTAKIIQHGPVLPGLGNTAIINQD